MIIPGLAFLEACPGIGLFVSGVILLSISTYLYVEQIVSLSLIVPLAFLGACLSDHLGFYAGRWFGPRLRQTDFAQRRSATLAKGEAFILKYGHAAIILGRLMTAVRSLVPMLLGAGGIKPLTFTLVDLLSCAIWSAGLGALVLGLDKILG